MDRIALKLGVILTGATGMVGEGVLHECLGNSLVDRILVINRKPCGVSHPKLKEIIHRNFFDLTSIQGQLKNYNTCFFCLGVSAVGMKENDYHRFTYDLTMHAAQVLLEANPEMTFCYISGAGTDSTEKGRSMWARLKGKTENHLMQLPFKKTYMFRPGYMHPTKGLKNTLKWYGAISWLYPVLRSLFPNSVTTLKELGVAMINAAYRGYDKPVLEVKDILKLSAEALP